MKFIRWIKEFLISSLFAIAWGIVVFLCRWSIFTGIIPFVVLDCIVGYVYKNKIITDKYYYLAQAQSKDENKQSFNSEYYDLYHEFNYNRVLIILRSIIVALALGPIVFSSIIDTLDYIISGLFLIIAIILVVSILLFAGKRDTIIIELINKRKKDWFSNYTAEDIEILNKLGKTDENGVQHS